MPSNPYAEALKQKKRPLFVPFVVLGDPDKRKSVEIIRTLVESGADALELGFPFSDPPADGPVIQAADLRALGAGIRIDDCFAILKHVRTFTKIPICLHTYYNLVLQRGGEKFFADAAAAMVDAILIPDLPLEHAHVTLSIAKKFGIAQAFIISELTTDARMEEIAKVAAGYLYVVSYLGVTGVPDAIIEQNIHATIQRAKKFTPLPCIVGFGIATPDQAKAAVRAGADGVIVGSRIVREVLNPTNVAGVCRLFVQSIG